MQSSLTLRFVKLAREGYGVDEIARVLGIPVSRARLIASTLAGSGLIRVAQPRPYACGSCESCPLRSFCGFTPIRPVERLKPSRGQR